MYVLYVCIYIWMLDFKIHNLQRFKNPSNTTSYLVSQLTSLRL